MKRRILIISKRTRVANRIATEIENLNNDVRIIDPRKIIGFNNGEKIMWVSTSSKQEPIKIYADDVSYMIPYCKHPIIEYLNKSLGIQTTNKYDSIVKASNKYRSSLMLKQSSLPVAREALITTSDINLNWIYDNMGYPQIMKTLTGSQGSGVHLVKDKRAAQLLGSQLLMKYGKFIIQEFVNTAKSESLPHDFRLFVIDGQVVATMKRTATTGIKTNHSIHHNSESIEANDEMKQLAILAANRLGLKIAGVDIAKDIKKNKWIIYEVNSCPGLGIEKITNTNIAKRIAQLAMLYSYDRKAPLSDSLRNHKRKNMSAELEQEEMVNMQISTFDSHSFTSYHL